MRNNGLENLKSRIRINFPDEKPIYKPTTIEESVNNKNIILDESIDLNIQSNRLSANSQQDRMIIDERRSFEKALYYSYQASTIKNLSNNHITRALINKSTSAGNISKENYDDKTISVAYEFNIKPGSVIEWMFNNTKWIVYLQDYSKKAYFRGVMRKCDYEIKWKDEDGNINKTYCAVIGPQEKNIDSNKLHNTIIDEPNYSLQLLIPNNEKTIKYFKRYSKFYLDGNDTCWRIEAINNINIPGIIKVYAKEYYSNEHQDDIENGIVDGLINEPTKDLSRIIGPNIIKPKITYTYKVIYLGESEWSVDDKYPVEIKENGKEITLIWTKNYTGTFELKYGNIKKIIEVKSLF